MRRFPFRLIILQATNSGQLYILVGERTVREYKADITEVIEPQIKELIERAEKGMKILERREASLQAKVCPSDFILR